MTTLAPELPQRNNSTSLRRALRVLDAVSGYRGQPCGISLTSLAVSLEMSKSTVLRLIAPLRDEGLIHQDRDSGRYRLGPAAARLGAAFVERVDVGVLASDLLRDLSRRTGGTAVLVVPGMRQPAIRTAGSVLLLALGIPADDGPGAVKAVACLHDRGWSIEIDDSAAGPDRVTMAAPVRDHLSRVVAAVESTLPGPGRVRAVGIERLRGEHSRCDRTAVGDAVRDCAESLSERLGAPRRGSARHNGTTR